MKKSDIVPPEATAKAAPATKPAAPKDEPKRQVILDKGKVPGLRSCGDYAVGQVYTVPASEAARLVEFKKFRYVQEG